MKQKRRRGERCGWNARFFGLRCCWCKVQRFWNPVTTPLNRVRHLKIQFLHSTVWKNNKWNFYLFLNQFNNFERHALLQVWCHGKAFLSVVIHTLPNKQKFPSLISGGHIIMSNNRSWSWLWWGFSFSAKGQTGQWERLFLADFSPLEKL